ncbi:MAG: hypothetical protein ACC742_07285 [Thermoanaerobaculales bacterium]
MSLSGLMIGLAGVLVPAAVLLGRSGWRRRRRLSRLLAAAVEVEAAVSDGRLPRSTGEALLQHLEGLRKACAGDRKESSGARRP